jgi:uncharacterized phage protein (TIGR01671 family)
MRDIKFRAWSPSRKVMGEPFKPFPVMGGIFNKDEVLMQYTGLKDKDGKEIYEGDLMIDGMHKYPHKIIYTLGSFVGKEIKGKFHGYADGIFFDRFKVIGNIYENPELLNNTKH